jgi:hypothetical protein
MAIGPACSISASALVSSAFKPRTRSAWYRLGSSACAGAASMAATAAAPAGVSTWSSDASTMAPLRST